MSTRPPAPGAASRSGARTAEALAELERLLESVRSPSRPLGLSLSARCAPARQTASTSRSSAGTPLAFASTSSTNAEDATPARSIILDAARNKTGDIWHVWLAGIRPGQLYGFRIAGPYAPHEGHRFNPNKLVVDPYATAIAPIVRQ